MKFKDFKTLLNAIPDQFLDSTCVIKIEAENFSLDSVLIEFNLSDKTINPVLPVIVVYGE